MKTKKFAALLAATVGALVVTGCVSTVSGDKTAGVPFLKDTLQARYEKPLDQVYDAALDVIKNNGMVVKQSILNQISSQTNTPASPIKTIEGKINQRTVYVRVQQNEPPITDVSVQARTQGGGSDVDLAAQINTQIALKLAR
jgi:outer membrane murein-binding lipoprotein Lpp